MWVVPAQPAENNFSLLRHVEQKHQRATRMAQQRKWWSTGNLADSDLFDYAPVAELANATGATAVLLEQ